MDNLIDHLKSYIRTFIKDKQLTSLEQTNECTLCNAMCISCFFRGRVLIWDTDKLYDQNVSSHSHKYSRRELLLSDPELFSKIESYLILVNSRGIL